MLHLMDISLESASAVCNCIQKGSDFGHPFCFTINGEEFIQETSNQTGREVQQSPRDRPTARNGQTMLI